MVRSSLRTCAALAVVLALGSVCRGDLWYVWFGQGGDNLWSNPDNWLLYQTGENLVPTGAPNDYVILNGLLAEANPPLIQNGIDAVCGILSITRDINPVIPPGDYPAMNMTGGTLVVTGQGIWWGDDAGCQATFNMSGGVINLTGDPGIFEIGWQEDGSSPQCRGTWNMTGGAINCKGISMPGGGGAYGELNVHGGQINVGTADGGLILRDDNAKVNVTRGTIVLEGDETVRVAGYVTEGWLVAYDGLRDVVCSYNALDNVTTVTAEPTLLGDANGDDKVNDADASILGSNWLRQSGARWGDGDFNFDGKVNDADAAILAAHWGEVLAGSSVPEPATMTLLVGLIGLAWLTRKWAAPRK
ncbi:MAG: dockerin type I domain-containing protein [Planctomycetia bacterium]|nr:dockerin type I domain-containing protein [Planctomycetia bacterium]